MRTYLVYPNKPSRLNAMRRECKGRVAQWLRFSHEVGVMQGAQTRRLDSRSGAASK